jgi:hypothetical protein
MGKVNSQQLWNNTMLNPKPIVADRIRNIRHSSFGWIDHNFLHGGFLNRLSQPELLLYYFLITVADRNGVSFYDYERICQLLKIELDDFLTARDRLIQRSLIAFADGIYQVLSLPKSDAAKPRPDYYPPSLRQATDEFQSLKQIFNQISR